MAKYEIIRINKMTCGNRRGLIDMDIQLKSLSTRDLYLLPGTNLSALPSIMGHHDAGIMTECGNHTYIGNDAIYNYYHERQKQPLSKEDNIEDDDYVLNEKQQQLSILDDSHSAIQLTPEEWLNTLSISNEDIERFNSSMSCMHVIYEFELDAESNIEAILCSNNTRYLPLNDILDVCVKSMFKKSSINYDIPGNLLLNDNNMTYNKNIDQYFVFDDVPVGFCSLGNDAIALSQKTIKQPYRIQSTLKSQIENNDIGSPHTFYMQQDRIETILYKSPYLNGYDSFQNYSGEDKVLLEQQSEIDLMTPQRHINGIEYNYIVNIEQNENPNSQYDNPTIYSNGDIFGSFMPGKNMYNALYSMEMKTSNAIVNCRTYIGLQNSGNGIALKYYDNCDYMLSKGAGKISATLSIEESNEKTMYPYQKIELFMPNQFSQLTKHKSNLFSIKLMETGLDEKAIYENKKQYDENTLALVDNMKKDISNAMKFLVDSIAPANTQLFATYFVEK